MNKISKVLMAAALGALAVTGSSLIQDQDARAQGSATVGSVRGTIRDKANGEAAVGATVVATSPALQGEQVVITDENGQYFITSLPPGIYTLTVYYNDVTFTRSNVLIQVGKEAVVVTTVDSGAATGKPKGEVIEIKGSAPIVDQGSTKTGVTITEDYTKNIPTSRTFGGVVGSAAGAQNDIYGVSLAGSTSAENVFIVEGINTTDTGFGGQGGRTGTASSNLPTEFISETEVITGGYNAEFGRATGGIVNVVTKQGSNTFHGSVFGYWRPGSLASAAETIQREGGSIDSKTDLDYRYDVGAELGGPIIKDKLWFHLGFNPSFTKQTTTRILATQVDKDGDGNPDVDPNTGFTVHDQIASSEIPSNYKTYYFTAKINGAIDQNNQFQISAFGNPRNSEFPIYVVTNPNNTQEKVDDGAYDLSAKWTSKLNQGKTQIDAVFGYHDGFENQNIGNPVQEQPFVYYNYERSLFDFADLEGMGNVAKCDDNSPSDPYPMIRNCPVTTYIESGNSFLQKRTNTRSSAALSLTQRVKAAGYHVFKAGLDAELPTYDANSRYTGGARWRRSANTAAGAPGRWQLRQFVTRKRNLTVAELSNPDNVMLGSGETLCAGKTAICSPVDQTGIFQHTDNRNLAAFVQDSWQLRPNFTINLGVRWEQQIGYVADELAGQPTPQGETVPKEGYRLDSMWAPRLGFIYDPTKEGKSKIFGHFGRFYENVPMDLNVRSFGGELINLTTVNLNRRTSAAGGYDPNCDVDHTSGMTGTQLAQRLSMCKDTAPAGALGGDYSYVSPGLTGQYTQEYILGTEYEVVPDLTVGANYIHRTMPNVIEDVSTDEGNNYLITNPSQNFDKEADKLMAQAKVLQMSTDPQQKALGDLYALRANEMYYVKNFTPPVRNYDAVQLIAKNRPSSHSLLQASYTYSRSKGNYPGLFSTETGQLDPNITSLYDLPDLMANRYGPLGLDRPHNLKVDGFYVWDLKKAGQLVGGISWRTQSGISHNALGAHILYGTDESYILPRGAIPRSPVTTQIDVRMQYGYRLSKNTLLEGFLDIFNLFNSQDELDVDERFTTDPVNPVVGGTVQDLDHLKQLDAATAQEINVTATKNKNFGHLNARNTPRAMQLGVRLTF